jgi:hypothetical protein
MDASKFNPSQLMEPFWVVALHSYSKKYDGKLGVVIRNFERKGTCEVVLLPLTSRDQAEKHLAAFEHCKRHLSRQHRKKRLKHVPHRYTSYCVTMSFNARARPCQEYTRIMCSIHMLCVSVVCWCQIYTYKYVQHFEVYAVCAGV